MYGLVVTNNGYGNPKEQSYNKSKIKVINPSSVRPVKSVNVEPSMYTDPRKDVPEPKPKVRITPTQLFSGGYKDRREFERAYQIYDILIRRGPAKLGGVGFGGQSLFPQSNRLVTSNGISLNGPGGRELLALSNVGTPAGINGETQTGETNTIESSDTSSSTQTPSSGTPSIKTPSVGDYINSVTRAITGHDSIQSPLIDDIIETTSSLNLMNVDSEIIESVDGIVQDLINENNSELINLRNNQEILNSTIQNLQEENERLINQGSSNEALNMAIAENQRLMNEGNRLLQSHETLQQEYIATLHSLNLLQNQIELPAYSPQRVEEGTQMSPPGFPNEVQTQTSLIGSPTSSTRKRRASSSLDEGSRKKIIRELETIRQEVRGGGFRGTAITRFINKVKKRVKDERGFPSLSKLALDSVMANVRRSSRNR